ncbi:glycosyltransferase [Pseudoroseomonas wenyumeiae]
MQLQTRTLPAPAGVSAPSRASRPLRLLTFTTLYPNAAQPNHGVFVENRLRHLVAGVRPPAPCWRRCPGFLRLPRFGDWARYATIPLREERHGLVLHHPRFLAPPRLGMFTGPAALYVAARAALRRLLAEGHRFDLIDAHYLYPDGVAAVRLGQEFGLPVVITARGSDTSQLPHFRLPGRAIRHAIVEADALIAVSAGLKSGLVELGAPEEKVTVLRNGVDLDTFRLAPSPKSRGRRWA